MPKISDLPSLSLYSLYYQGGITLAANGRDENGDYVTGQILALDAINGYLMDEITDADSVRDADKFIFAGYYGGGSGDDLYRIGFSDMISCITSSSDFTDSLSTYISDYINNGNMDNYLSSYLSGNIGEYGSYIVSNSGSYDEDAVVRDSSGTLHYLSYSEFASKVFSAIYYDDVVRYLDDDTKIIVMGYTDSYDPVFNYLSVGGLVEYIKENL